ncbi:MAG: 30S ribosomal protein S11 [Candidatus Latescibacterota bacterium]|nr:MAG: 30S ribosomal protein S11 [Candidatus Latescibacterota bacterium]
MAGPQRAKKKTKKVDAFGVVHIQSTFNNTIVSITDREGKIITWSSPGRLGYKGSRKSTPFAAQQAASTAAREAMSLGVKKVEAWVRGPGPGREAAIRSLRATGLEVSAIKDCTPIPHNGCRAKKRRRI